MENAENFTESDDIVLPGYLHGYEVQEKGADPLGTVDLMKLILSGQALPHDLALVLERLQINGFIEKNDDVIRDWLTKFFWLSKVRLEKWDNWDPHMQGINP